ncbi:hypothetical protein PV390_29225 [Streptomyces sp. ME02-6991-2A]|uniref:hypothetical protein n=1 Tax=Streptomyces sp. ME02-6991-2A TaxID=3028677 RepID=UPI0029B6BD1F|nr:hypothetical protein [Streptomyces sp. ME02-6991-2A]MDX3378483.1 hypothetical protein [Streptomyces sp. ME02-6991-2A]
MTTRTPGTDARARRLTRWWGNPRISRAAGRTAEGLRRLADRLDHAAGSAADRGVDRGVDRDAVRGPGAPGADGPDATTAAPAPPLPSPDAAPTPDAAPSPEAEPSPGPRPPAPEASPAPSPASPAASPVAPPDCVAVARDVLAVADRLRNEELARRLFDAVGRLPGLRVLRPSPGDAFEPAEHHWDETRPTDDPAREETVAALLAPGFSGPQNELIRTARVAVYATEVK